MDGMTKAGLTIVIAVMLAAAFIWGYNRGYDASTEDMEQRLAEVELTKSVKPQPVKEKNAGFAVVPVKSSVASPTSFTKKAVRDGIQNDTVTVTHLLNDSTDSLLYAYVPIRQKEYRDSGYTAYVSGYNASLDSLVIRGRAITRTRTEYRRWNMGITGGYGYGFLSRRLEPFVGIGITLNIFR